MFLLNSRTTLVTASCNCNHKTTIAGTPYTKDTGLICRIPSIRLHLHTLGFSPRGTCTGSGYGCPRFFLIPFSWSPEINWTDQRPAILGFNQVLIIKILPWFIPINTNDSLCQSIPKRQKPDLCCHVYLNSTRILTCFPFPFIPLGIELGPTNPWLNCIAKEPLPFRRHGF